jgi:hypothetical protein
MPEALPGIYQMSFGRHIQGKFAFPQFSGPTLQNMFLLKTMAGLAGLSGPISLQ